jgi:hypothetical protein
MTVRLTGFPIPWLSQRTSSAALGHCSVSSARPSNRACGSPAHGSPTSFTAGIRLAPPVPVGSGDDDDSVKADQAELVGRLEGND